MDLIQHGEWYDLRPSLAQLSDYWASYWQTLESAPSSSRPLSSWWSLVRFVARQPKGVTSHFVSLTNCSLRQCQSWHLKDFSIPFASAARTACLNTSHLSFFVTCFWISSLFAALFSTFWGHSCIIRSYNPGQKQKKVLEYSCWWAAAGWYTVPNV